MRIHIRPDQSGLGESLKYFQQNYCEKYWRIATSLLPGPTFRSTFAANGSKVLQEMFETGQRALSSHHFSIFSQQFFWTITTLTAFPKSTLRPVSFPKRWPKRPGYFSSIISNCLNQNIYTAFKMFTLFARTRSIFIQRPAACISA